MRNGVIQITFHLLVNRLLIAFECQDIVGIGFDNLLGDFLLTAQNYVDLIVQQTRKETQKSKTGTKTARK